MPSYDSDENDVEENIDIDSDQMTNLDAKNALNKSGKFKKGGWKEASLQDDERLKPIGPTEEKNRDFDDDIPYIPQLDDHGRQDESIAMAPQIAVNRVATYKELEIVLKEHAPFAAMGGDIDLKLLLLRLLPDANVKEKDEVWSWEGLLMNMKSELMTGKESNLLDIKLIKN